MLEAIHPLKRAAIEVATKDCRRLCNIAPLQHMGPQIGEDAFSALVRERRPSAGWAVVVDEMQWGARLLSLHIGTRGIDIFSRNAPLFRSWQTHNA